MAGRPDIRDNNHKQYDTILDRKMINKNRKGKEFEQRVARLLTELTGKKWMRTPHSGAYGTNHDILHQMGDVCTHDEKLSRLLIECKSCKTLTLNDVFSPKSKVWRWTGKCETVSDHWFLFIKADNKGIYVITRSDPARINLTGSLIWRGVYQIIKV